MDASTVSQYAWNISGAGYAVGRKKGHWEEPQRAMHLILLNIPKGSPQRIDHKNCNPIDNRRENLRPCTNAENSRNRRKVAGKKSKYLGVAFHRSYSSKKEKVYAEPKIRATIGFDNKQKHLGYFKTEEEAAIAYDTYARKIFGEFARVNFPQGNEQSALK